MEQRTGIQQQLSPALNVVLLLVVSVGVGIYTQEHLNRIWDAAGKGATPSIPGTSLPPPPS